MKMANVGEEVLRVIGTNRQWTKSYGVVAGLVRNPENTGSDLVEPVATAARPRHQAAGARSATSPSLSVWPFASEPRTRSSGDHSGRLLRALFCSSASSIRASAPRGCACSWRRAVAPRRWPCASADRACRSRSTVSRAVLSYASLISSNGSSIGRSLLMMRGLPIDGVSAAYAIQPAAGCSARPPWLPRRAAPP